MTFWSNLNKMQALKNKKVKKPIKTKDGYYLQVFSRHPSHNILRRKIVFPFPTSIRFGSTNRGNKEYYVVELNSPDAVRTSSDKLAMKIAFKNGGVKTANWIGNVSEHEIKKEDEKHYLCVGDKKLKFPIVTKHRHGSRGTGNRLHETPESFTSWFKTKDEESISNYIVEEFKNFDREYRLHVSKNGCFYTCRKALKSDAPQDAKWFRNDQNCVWLLEENEQFNKPDNWSQITEESVKALVSVGLDFGAVDLRVQAHTNKKGEVRTNPDFIVIEINSAPSFGDLTSQYYEQEIKKLIEEKTNI